MTKFNALAGMCGLNFVLESSGHYKLCAFINWENKVNLPALVFFFGFSLRANIQASEIEEKHRVTAVLFRVSVRGVCVHLYALPLCFSLTQLPLSLYPPIWPARSCYSFIRCLLDCVDLSKRYWGISPTSLVPTLSILNYTFEKHMWKIRQWFLNAQRSCY